jgi:hypothetical protein
MEAFRGCRTKGSFRNRFAEVAEGAKAADPLPHGHGSESGLLDFSVGLWRIGPLVVDRRGELIAGFCFVVGIHRFLWSRLWRGLVRAPAI